MDLLIEANRGETEGVAVIGDLSFPCALGRSGLLPDKKEGDGGTPIGCYPLRHVFYRKDRVAIPETDLPLKAIGEQDGWCDDPMDRAYNTKVDLPYSARHEHLWRQDHVYDIVLVVGYNDAPVIPGKGSAVFVHVARLDFSPTEGCVAFKEEDLRSILRRLSLSDSLILRTLSKTPNR